MFSKVVSSSQCWMYLRYEKAFERIVSCCPAAEEDDEYDPDEV